MAIDKTQMKNNVYKAIEVIAEQRIDNLKLDKTIIGTIDGRVGGSGNKYRIKYNGGSLYAYAQDNSVYLPNLTVYVLIPENDFNNKKWIIGRVSSTTTDSNVSTVASALNNYSIIGTNVIQVNEKASTEDYKNVFKLQSYSKRTEGETFQDANILYDAKNPELSVLDINNTDLQTYVRRAQALSFAADFRTSLSPEQKRHAEGNYGLLFNLRFKNKNNAYSTIQEKWEALEPNTRKEVYNQQGEIIYKQLNDYKVEIDDILNNPAADATPQSIQQLIQEQVAYLTDFYFQIRERIDEETQGLVDQYLQLLSDLLELTVDLDGNPITIEDIKTEYFNWFSSDSDTYTEVIQSTYLDVDNMVGNPYNYSQYAHQYILQDIDPETFIGIDSIYFFCDGFVENAAKATLMGYDIFVSNIELNCLEPLDDEDSEYRLQLTFPQGTIFKTNNTSDTRSVYANVLYQGNQDVTSATTIRWFKKDSSITSPSQAGYHAFAGLGWKRIDDTAATMANKNFVASDNKAYENYYKVIATRNLETILTKEFVLYNEANRRNIEIISDTGFAYELSATDKTLICTIDGEDIIDTNYKFLWSIDGKSLNLSESDLISLIEQAQQDYLDTSSLEALQRVSSYKTQLNQIQGISWEENRLIYPASQMPSNGQVIVTCTVRMRDNSTSDSWYDIGQAEAKLTQGEVVNLKGYYIEIENGNQAFQYNEAGVSPASERYNNPIEVLPLQCNFYSPNGGLINKINYTVKWKLPINNSLIIPAENSLIAGPDGLTNINPNSVCIFQIADDYDYAAINNQITCIVEFNGDVYAEDTNFYFGKIGENGTNGTDVIAKIVPIGEETNSVLNRDLLTLIIQDDEAKWNTGALIDTPILQLQLYRRNLLIDEEEYRSVRWEMAGSIRARHMSVFASTTSTSKAAGVVSFDIEGLEDTASRKYYTNQIVKGQASLKVDSSEGFQNYNYFYPIPVIWKYQSFSIGIDKNLTMRQVLYNADGRNPAYNHNQGVKLNIDDDYAIIEWSAKGGVNEDINSALEIKYTDDDTFVYVTPVDVYSGEWVNNYIQADVYADEEKQQLICTVVVPIHISLNTYGLASLNAWDGNSIEINQDDSYILAPQIGAGVKHEEENTFTGVVMGTEQTYEDNEFGEKDKKQHIGLLGYSHGRQSIFLNAEDGSATFGLPEDQADENYPYEEGRIKLQPNGTSYIGNWKIGSRILYNSKPFNSNESYPKERGAAYASVSSPYKNTGHLVDLDPQAQGIMLSADPAYISIKSRMLTEADLKTKDGVITGSRQVNPGDSIEVQLDPNQRSTFGIFRHYKDKNEVWQRKQLVGIDNQGRFYSNAIQDDVTTLGVGLVGAFGIAPVDVDEVNPQGYLGINIDSGGTTIFKAFVDYDYNEGIEGNTPLYISGATSENNDYLRPIQIMGSQLKLRTSANDDNSRINMTTTTMMLGQKNAKFELNNTTGSLTTSGAFTRTIKGLNTETLTAGSTINITGALNQSVTGNTSITLANSEVKDDTNTNRFRVYGKTQNNVIPYDLWLSRNGTDNSYLTIRNHRFILQSEGSYGTSGLDGGSIGIHALKTNFGISLRATPVDGSTTAYNAGLRLLPSRGGTSSFNLYAEGRGQVYTIPEGFNIDGITQYGVSIRSNAETAGLYVSSNNINYGDASNPAKASILTSGDIYIKPNAGGYKFAYSSISATNGNYTKTADGSNLWDLIYDCLAAAADARQAAANAYNHAEDAYNYAINTRNSLGSLAYKNSLSASDVGAASSSHTHTVNYETTSATTTVQEGHAHSVNYRRVDGTTSGPK